MARELTAAVAAALTAGTIRPVFFYEGVYSSGTLRLWSGVNDYTWNGQVWAGAGEMLGVSAIEEQSDVRASGFSVSLTADSAIILALNLSAVRQGLAGRVWMGVFDAAGVLIVDPFKCFEGRLDAPDILLEGARATVQVKYESRLIDLDRARERRYTQEDQQIDYPADLGFEFVPGLQDKAIFWGRPSAAQEQASQAQSQAQAQGFAKIWFRR